VGGGYPSEGRVEICINNAFGTICDDGWSNEDAQVICRQLGYSNGTGRKTCSELSDRIQYILTLKYVCFVCLFVCLFLLVCFYLLSFFFSGAVAVPGAFFGRGSQLIHLSLFGCSGDELSWQECRSDSYTFLCGHARDASVLCQCEWLVGAGGQQVNDGQ